MYGSWIFPVMQEQIIQQMNKKSKNRLQNGNLSILTRKCQHKPGQVVVDDKEEEKEVNIFEAWVDGFAVKW